MNKSKVSAKLDWSEMLGFEQIAADRSAARVDKLGNKIGNKAGGKAGISAGDRIGSKTGVKG